MDRDGSRTAGHSGARGARPMTPFARAVLDAVESIPRGRVLSYGDVAELVGAGGARAVGAVLARYGGEVAWHRVLHSDGSCAAGQADRQLPRLRAEGVPARGERVDMAAARWTPDEQGPGSGGR